MRIVSKFRDYYDCIQAAGQDQSLVYVREEIEDAWEGRKLGVAFPPPPLGRYYFRPNLFYCHEYLIGFCGKLYPVLAVYKGAGDKNTFCYSADDIAKFVEANYRKNEIERFHETKSKHRWRRPVSMAQFVKFFEKCEEEKAKQPNPEIFKHPIFVLDMQYKYKDGKHLQQVTWNPCLRPYEFFRVLDPYTAFQELQMYLGSLAVPQKPIPVPSDKDMVVAKGFDKWSFRKPPKNEPD